VAVHHHHIEPLFQHEQQQQDPAGLLLAAAAAAVVSAAVGDVDVVASAAAAEGGDDDGEFVVATAAAAVAAAATTAVVAAATTIERATAQFLMVHRAIESHPELFRELAHDDEEDESRPLLWKLLESPVLVDPENHNAADALEDVLQQFDYLVLQCSRLASSSSESVSKTAISRRAPGFFTGTSDDGWTTPNQLVEYQTYSAVAAVEQRELPVMSPESAYPVLLSMRQAVVERLRYAQDREAEKERGVVDDRYCSCVSKWDHLPRKNLTWIVNQALEQAMVQEASDRLCDKWTTEDGRGETWSELYAANGNDVDEAAAAAADAADATVSPIKLLRDRDTYLDVLVRSAMVATSSIQIMTCYVFWEDPAQKYIFLDLLPYLVRSRRGMKIEILIDLMTVESATLKSLFEYTTTAAPDGSAAPPPPPARTTSSNVTSTSFLRNLPSDAPLAMNAMRKFATAAEFWQALFEATAVADEAGGYIDSSTTVRFWCARDAKDKYRIKNHAKCVLFDREVCIMGGSNLAPTVASATTELDVLTAGDAAARVGRTFDTLWGAMTNPNGDVVEETKETQLFPIEEEKKSDIDESTTALMEYAMNSCEWDDAGSSVSIVRSTPSSDGEDVIYRVVLDKIRSAEKSILVCMGHSCFCRSFAEALREATEERNVNVQILVNSKYSNDLRTGQRDLFVSIRELLRIAPKVQVYSTKTIQDRRPEFLHAKYVVVDGHWSALGSWNLWTRAAFYEIEHEAFIESESVAAVLKTKFESNKAGNTTGLPLTLEDCRDGGTYCPKGCSLCAGFGPFCV